MGSKEEAVWRVSFPSFSLSGSLLVVSGSLGIIIPMPAIPVVPRVILSLTSSPSAFLSSCTLSASCFSLDSVAVSSALPVLWDFLVAAENRLY